MVNREYVWIECANALCKQKIPVPFTTEMDQTHHIECGATMKIEIKAKE